MAKMINQEFKVDVLVRNIKVNKDRGDRKVTVSVNTRASGTPKTASVTVTKSGVPQVIVEFRVQADSDAGKNEKISQMLAQALGDSKVQKAVKSRARGYEIVYKGSQLGFQSSETQVDVKKARTKSEAIGIAHSIALKLATAQGAVLARKSVHDYVAAGGSESFHALVRRMLERFGEDQRQDSADEVASTLVQYLRDLGSQSFYSLVNQLRSNGISGGSLNIVRLQSALEKAKTHIRDLINKELYLDVGEGQIHVSPGINKVTLTIGTEGIPVSATVSANPNSEDEEIDLEFSIRVDQSKNQAIVDRLKSAFEKAINRDTINPVESLVRTDFDLQTIRVDVQANTDSDQKLTVTITGPGSQSRGQGKATLLVLKGIIIYTNNG